ncbi:hypothetical protein ACEPAH_4342 [Sanghuangporus vaninii]
MINLPEDILLAILHYLDVADILRLERTCKHIHGVIATRHLWLSKLYDLDQYCAPNLPSHVDPNTLTCTELRDAVVKAERSYHLITEDSSPFLGYRCVKTISVGRPEQNLHELSYRHHNIKLTTDGRYLFMTYLFPSELRLFDLEDGGRQIWTSNVAAIHPSLRESRCMISYAFEQHADSSMTIVLSISQNPGPVTHGYLQVLRLELSSANGGVLRETEIFRSELDGGYASQPMISIDLVVALSGVYSVLVWRRDNWQLTRIQIPSESLLVFPMDFKMWRDHLFCVVHLKNGGTGLWSFSLPETLKSSRSSSTVVLDPSNVSYLEVPIRKFHYSIYRDPWDPDQHTAVVSFVGTPLEGLEQPPILVSARTIFDRRKQVSAKWISIDIHSTRCVWEDGRNNDAEGRYFVEPLAPPSRSGQLSVIVGWLRTMQLSRRYERRFASLKRSGGVVLRRFSKNVLSHGDSELRDPEVPPHSLSLDMDPYSGMLIKITNRVPLIDLIEFYCLA